MPADKALAHAKPSTKRLKSTAALEAKVAALRQQLSALIATSQPPQAKRRPRRRRSTHPGTMIELPKSTLAEKFPHAHELQTIHPTAFNPPEVRGSVKQAHFRQKESPSASPRFNSLGDIPPGNDEDVFFGGLLDLARIHWLTGRWEDLADIDLLQIESHPERARLALFGAVGWLSKKDTARAKTYMQVAVRYGCPAHLISRVLLTGAHASLAATYSLAGRDRLSLKHINSLQQISPLSRHGGLESLPRQRPEDPASANAAGPDCMLSPRLRALATSSVAALNPTEAVAQALRSQDLTARERFVFLREVATQFLTAGKKMVASGFLEEASHLSDGCPESYRFALVKDLLGMGLREEAFQMALRGLGTQTAFTAEEKLKLGEARDTLREKIYNAKGHGHEVLLSFLRAKAEALNCAKAGKPPVLIEIGTTRESGSGQGSTRRLMEFCRKNGFHFITVDMDSVNAQTAGQMFRDNGVAFEAIHAKGEDYLAAYEGDLDCVFLDAYDFDHGKHTELRQSRYEKFLGARISNTDCHKMHLDCAQAIVKTMQPWTLVCMDDTWLDAGRWTAKGTLSMPYFLENGLGLLDVRNKSALLGGPDWFQTDNR
jgi:hypothetical protein